MLLAAVTIPLCWSQLIQRRKQPNDFSPQQLINSDKTGLVRGGGGGGGNGGAFVP